MMTANRFRQVRHLFEAVLERPERERSAFLEDASQGDPELMAEVQRLLAAHLGKTGMLDHPAVVSSPERWEGRRLGAYEILREIGSGGMGTVYLAARADRAFERLVAIKLVRPDVAPDEVLHRFQRERQILAALDHPHIARLLDAGTTPGGLPYFVMEYVDGKPIDRYCDEHALDLGDRLRLFDDVCRAVEYAHRQRVIHRDLKPANILVTNGGAVKLLDFGIARLLNPALEQPGEALTRTEMRMMTPEYASPEQVRGEQLSYATDVYSLGVVLYELLTGTPPYHLRSRLIHEVIRVICEVEPIRPSTAVAKEPAVAIIRSRRATPTELQEALEGDLDSILCKALAKDPAQRYDGPSDLRLDIDRYISGQRVSARSGAAIRPVLGVFRNHPVALAWTGSVVVGILAGWIHLEPILLKIIGITVVSFLLGGWLVTRFGTKPVPASEVWRIFAYVMFSMVASVSLILRLSGDSVEWANLLMNLAGMLWFAWQLGRWIFRERFWGACLLDLSTGSKVGPFGFGILLLFGVVFLIQSITAHQRNWMNTSFSLYMIFSSVYGIFVQQRMEVRESGVVTPSGFFRWRQLVAYRWQDELDSPPLLHLRIARRLPFFRTMKLRVPSKQKSALNGILQERLAEWPDR